jgi:hypothetical protein
MTVRLAVVLGILALLAAGDANDWKKFQPPGEGFSVLLPGDPKDISPPAKADDPTVQKYYIYPLGQDRSYMVGVTVFKEEKLTPEAQQRFVASVTDGLSAQFKAKLIETKDLKVKAGLGKEWLFQRGDLFIRARLYVDQNAARVFTVASTEDQVKGKDGAKFLDSVRLGSE